MALLCIGQGREWETEFLLSCVGDSFLRKKDLSF